MKREILKLENVKKSFNSRTVLDSINLEILEGEIFGIIGSSGSGKTTLLKIMIGFMQPSSGEVVFRNHGDFLPVFENLKLAKRTFGFAAQSPSLYEKLTVFENLDYFGCLYGLSKEARLANINILLDLVELSSARNIIAQNLSGGMQRRLDIACALIQDPKILILDEPTSDLDPMLAKHIWKLIQKINKRGTTIIVASHHLSEIESLCDRISILSSAKIKNIGTIQELTNMLSKGQEIRIETYPGNYSKILESIDDPLIISKENRGNMFVLNTKKPDKILSKILRVLAEKDETLLDLNISKLSLSDVFEKITKK